MAAAAYWSGALTVITLMILSARRVLMMLADLRQAAWSAAAVNAARVGEIAAIPSGTHRYVVAAGGSSMSGDGTVSAISG
jgi:hypothetical protein